MAFFKKYCPVWVFDCVVAQSVSDFILYGVDLAQPCKKFAGGLTGIFEEVSHEELVRNYLMAFESTAAMKHSKT